MPTSQKHNPFSLQGRRALITGSSGGIGLALAQALGQAGAAVVLNGRDADRLQTAQAALVADGLQVEVAAFDVTNSDAVHAGVADIEQRLGAINTSMVWARATSRPSSPPGWWTTPPSPPGWSAAHRAVAGAMWKTWAARRCFWPAMPRVLSVATFCTSTAASPPLSEPEHRNSHGHPPCKP